MEGRLMGRTQETVAFATLGYYEPRERLAWALEIAQTDLSLLTSRQRQALRTRVLEFVFNSGPGVSGDPNALTLPQEDELPQIQDAFRLVLQTFADKAPADDEFYHTWLSHFPEGFGPPDMGGPPFAPQCRYGLLKLINHMRQIWLKHRYTHPLIQVCTATKPRSQDRCGRLFLGKGNRQYCSPVCQNRAGTRRFRAAVQA
jgi:hypothetical protein